jgi:hypothetical protein
MSEDIVKKLRVPPDLMTDFGRVGVIGEAAAEIERLRARVEVLEQLARESLHVLACREEDDDPGHWCVHCDEYVDRNGTHRSALRAALEAKP